LTGGRCSEVDLALKLLGRDLGWSLLTGGRYLEVVVCTGLTVLLSKCISNMKDNQKQLVIRQNQVLSMLQSSVSQQVCRDLLPSVPKILIGP
jgi:hypothetical protein